MAQKDEEQKVAPIGAGSGGDLAAGAGSGGDGITTYHEGKGDHIIHCAGIHGVAGGQVTIEAVDAMPPVNTMPPEVRVMAFNHMMDSGKIALRGTEGVRITAGTAPFPPMMNDSLNGVEVQVNDPQNIKLSRGLIPKVDQTIDMEPNAITIDAGIGTLTLQSMMEIVIQCANGVASIKLTPEAIILQGPMIMIN